MTVKNPPDFHATMRYLSQKPAETIIIASEIAAQLRGGDIVVFSGGLGSGKTTFMKGVARYYGISRIIQSPTFVIAKIYPLKKFFRRAGAKHLLHLDTYRLANRSQLTDLGLDDRIGAPDTITCIENPKRLFPKIGRVRRVVLRTINERSRFISFY